MNKGTYSGLMLNGDLNHVSQAGMISDYQLEKKIMLSLWPFTAKFVSNFKKLEKVCKVCGQLALNFSEQNMYVKFSANWP